MSKLDEFVEAAGLDEVLDINVEHVDNIDELFNVEAEVTFGEFIVPDGYEKYNIRKGPGFEYAVVDTARAGEKFVIYEVVHNEERNQTWIRVGDNKYMIKY